MGDSHSTECNSAEKYIWQSYIEKEIWIFAAHISRQRMILRLTGTLEFSLVIRKGIAKARHFKQLQKILGHLYTSLSLG